MGKTIVYQVYESEHMAELNRLKREKAKRDAPRIRAEILADSSNYKEKYLFSYDEREILPEGDYSTAYIELFVGKWDGKSFHHKNSKFLSYDWIDSVIIRDLIECAIGMDPYGVNACEITPEKWRQVGIKVQDYSEVVMSVYKEIDSWIGRVFETEEIVSLIPM